VVYEIPQSRERIRGREAYVQSTGSSPATGTILTPAKLRQGSARPLTTRRWSSSRARTGWRFQWRVGDDLPEEAFVFFGVRDGLLASVTDFWPEPYDPPTGREHLTQRW